MIADRPQRTPAEVRARAQEWYDRQIAALKLAHGDAWERNREWLEDYLKEELRERLVAIGWRRK